MRAYYASRALQALELLSFQNLSCPQLAAALGTHPRTARRLLKRLVADGYSEQAFDSRRRYRATLRLAALGRQLIAHADLPRAAAPHVAALSAQTGGAAHLFIPSYRDVVCVVHSAPASDLPEPMLQELLPAHATAPGKVLLAHRQAWRDSILQKPLRAGTDRTLTSQTDIQSTATQIRALGYAIDDGEFHAATLAIAVPVFVESQVPAALALSIRPRTSSPTGIDALVESLTRTAAAISSSLSAFRTLPIVTMTATAPTGRDPSSEIRPMGQPAPRP